MSVTTTSLGANTVHITISGETTPANFITALDAAIVNGGWSQVDVSNPYNRIYSAPNVDGSTVKYIGITIDPGILRISTTSYESWNASTHVGTNETWTFNRAGSMGFAFNYCDVVLMINPRWLFLQTFIRNQASCWSGVIELAREAPEDTVAAGYPCWCWMSSATVMTQLPATTPVVASVSFPRTVGGLTGYAAAGTTSLQTPYTRFGAASQLGQAFSTLPNYTTYAWNIADKVVHSTRPVVGTTELHGRLFGLKLTFNIGSPYSQVSLPIDSNYAYSATGTNTQHWVLGAHPSTTMGTLFNSTANYSSGSVTAQSCTLPAGCNITAVEPVGYYYYAATVAGIVKIDASATTLATIGVISGTSGKSFHNIVYDNAQYCYAAGPDGVYRIDTLNSDTVTFLATNANGVAGLWWDGTYVWAGIRTAATSSQLFQISPSTFTITGTITLAATSMIVGGICSDNVGNTYAIATNGVVYKIVNSGLTVSVLYSTGWTGIGSVGVYYNGVQLTICCTASSNLFFKTITTSGSVLLTGSLGAYTTLSSLTTCVQMGKFGVYDYYAGGFNQYCTLFCTDMSGVVNAQPVASQPNLTLSSFQTDNNRAFGGLNTTFIQYTTVFRPDDNTTAYGRLLLPV